VDEGLYLEMQSIYIGLMVACSWRIMEYNGELMNIGPGSTWIQSNEDPLPLLQKNLITWLTGQWVEDRLG